MTENALVASAESSPAPADTLGPRSYPARPFVAVGVVVFRGEQVLLVRRGKSPRKGQWSIPGGAQHAGETVQDAGLREVREETGVEVRISDLVDVLDYIDHDDMGRIRHHYTLIDWAAEWVDGQARPGDDVTDVMWADLNSLDAHALWDETRRVIEQAARKRSKADP
ncbi:MAG: NUDIX hydrolase [Sphingomonadales bacterium]